MISGYMQTVDTFSLTSPEMLLVIVTGILVIITAIYAYFTYKLVKTASQQSKSSTDLVEATNKQIKLLSNPVIGIDVSDITITPVFNENKRRQLIAELILENLGNAPAIDLRIDGEIILEFTDLEGIKAIPAFPNAGTITYLKIGEIIPNNRISSKEPHIRFEAGCINQLITDQKERNKQRSGTLISDLRWSRIKIYVYYKNNLEQYFVSTYEACVYMLKESPQGTKKFVTGTPSDNEIGELRIIRDPPIKLSPKLITKEEMDLEISNRDKIRDINTKVILYSVGNAIR
jgi:hypothetical protein